MKTILLAILLTSVLTIRLDLPLNPQIDDKNNRFKIGVLDANTPVSFAFIGLPQGFECKGDQLSYTGNVGLQGHFPVKITATDGNGKTDTSIVLLGVNLSGNGNTANSASGSDSANPFVTRPSVVTIGQISGSNSASSSSSVSGSSSSTTTTSSSSSSSSSSSGSSSNINGNQNAGPQILSINGVNYNFGNGLTLNVGINGNAANQQTLTEVQSQQQQQQQSNSLNSVISQYSNNTNVISSSQNITYYPIPALPSGPIPNSVPNTNVIQIATAQAQISSQPTRQFSEYDTNITNLFYEQTQLTQTIANLLQIIRQGTANRKQAQDDINVYTEQLNSGVSTQQNLSICINQQENKIKSIQSALDGANTQLNSNNADLNNVNSQINTVKTNGLGLTQQLSIALNAQDSLKDQIKNAQGNIASITTQLNTQTQSCNQANQVIAGLRANISALQNTIVGVDQKINGIDSQICDYNAQISNLQKQIDDLQKKVAQAKNDKQNLINLNYTVPQQIANLNSQISIQQASCSSENGGYTNADLTAAQNKLAGLQGQLTDTNNVIVNINTNITLAKSQLTDLLNKSALLTQNINKIQGNINSLKQQLPLEEAQLSKVYVQGNQIAQSVKSANASLQVALVRFKRENDALTIANINLQQARTQQQTIGQKINLVLQQNTAGLPFPSAPEESGLLSSFNNANSIDSISGYLLRAYGAGLGLDTFNGFDGIRTLYSFGSSRLRSNCPEVILSSSSSSSASSSSSSSSSASASSNSSASASSGYCGKGKILKVNSGNVVDVETPQGVQSIALDECSIRLANIPNYNINVGDVLVWKGTYDNNRKNWMAKQVTCLH